MYRRMDASDAVRCLHIILQERSSRGTFEWQTSDTLLLGASARLCTGITCSYEAHLEQAVSLTYRIQMTVSGIRAPALPRRLP
jgi:hypothetical protein